MYGYNLGDNKSIVFNYFILFGKRHAFVRRLEFKPPRLDLLVELVKEKINVQKAVNALKPQQSKLNTWWKPFLSLSDK